MFDSSESRYDLPTSDADRRDFIQEFVAGIDHEETNLALNYLPLADEDPDDVEYERYFQFLQRWYMVEIILVEDVETEEDREDFAEFVEELKNEAEHFGYPTDILLRLDTSKPRPDEDPARGIIAALLFNSQAEAVKNFHGHAIEKLLLGASVLQGSGEQVVITGGDVVVHGYQENPYVITQEVFGKPRGRDGRLDHGELMPDPVYEAALAGRAFALVIHGASRATIVALEKKLLKSGAYLGWKELNWDHEAHKVILGEYMEPRYLLKGLSIKVPPSGPWSDEDALPQHRVEDLREWGFVDVGVAEEPLKEYLS